LRQIDGVDQGEAGQRAGDDGEQEQHGQRELTREFAPVMQGNRLRLPAARPGKEAWFIRLRGNCCQTIQAS